MASKPRLVFWPLLVALLTVLMDQVSKYFVVHFLGPCPSPDSVEIWGSFLRLTCHLNTGISFGRLQEFSAGITLFSLVVIVGLLAGYRFLLTSNRWANLALGLLLGGAVGNLIDRLLTSLTYGLNHAYVVDFVDVKYFAVFNVADSAITVGGIAYGVYLLFFRGRPATETGRGESWSKREELPPEG